MDEDTVREKLKKASDKEKEEDQARALAFQEQKKRMQAIKTDIRKELTKWMQDLPMDLDARDNVPFDKFNRSSFYLSKKRGTKEIIVERYEPTGKRVGKGVVIEEALMDSQTIDNFMEYLDSWGGERGLVKLKERIPEFIEYLSTNI